MCVYPSFLVSGTRRLVYTLFTSFLVLLDITFWIISKDFPANGGIYQIIALLNKMLMNFR